MQTVAHDLEPVRTRRYHLLVIDTTAHELLLKNTFDANWEYHNVAIYQCHSASKTNLQWLGFAVDIHPRALPKSTQWVFANDAFVCMPNIGLLFDCCYYTKIYQTQNARHQPIGNCLLFF